MSDVRAQALDWLGERQAIADALSLFCERVDRGDIDGVVELFTEDCVTDYGPHQGGALQGRETFRSRISRSQARFTQTHHQLGQVRVEQTPEGAQSVSYVTASHRFKPDGQRFDAHLQYHDTWRRTAEGWRIAGRAAYATIIDGLPAVGGDRRWLQRLPINPEPR